MKKVMTLIEFEWDKGNIDKNWRKHKVKNGECEQVFFDEKNIVLPDSRHSIVEERFLLLGKTKRKRRLLISYTIRNTKVRVISARDQNKKERSLYENKKI